MGKHTAGPWSIVENLVDGFTPDIVGQTPDDIVCRLYGGQFEIVEANAALISAAPDLLQALEAISNEFGNTKPNFAKIGAIADAAIARARGQ